MLHNRQMLWKYIMCFLSGNRLDMRLNEETDNSIFISLKAFGSYKIGPLPVMIAIQAATICFNLFVDSAPNYLVRIPERCGRRLPNMASIVLVLQLQ